MIDTDVLISFLLMANEVLTSATVIVAVSMLLYNLAHGPNDRVARASSALLGSVSLAYLGDVLVAITRSPDLIESWLRFGWIGVALAPAALFHLSSALLETTGLQSRGRRRRVVRLLYLIGCAFAAAAGLTDLLIHSPILRPLPLMQPGPLFGVYFIYSVVSTVFAFNNVLRARRRCLTRATHRRMTYLLFALITPVVGIFPYSLLFPLPVQENLLAVLLLTNAGNFAIVFMLAFMAYPLAFFGPSKSDRVIKAELLSFMLRGPVTGIAVLIVVMFTPRLSGIGIPGAALMPFLSVAVVLGLQWSFTVIIPFLERKLIYTADQDQARMIQELGAHVLTEADARQLLEATLAAVCDYMRVPSAFAATVGPDGVHLELTVGPLAPRGEDLNTPEFLALVAQARNGENGNGNGDNHAGALRDAGAFTPSNSNGAPTQAHVSIAPWGSYWIVPLKGTRGGASAGRLAGVMGIWARSPEPDLQPEEEIVFRVLYTRVARVLDDMRLQTELFSRLEDIIQESDAVRAADTSVRYGNASELARLAEAASVVDQPDFVDVVRAALRDYWGGPGLTDERLAKLTVVRQLLADNENQEAKAIRAIINQALERIKPGGNRSMTAAEWVLYNIIDLRFIQGKKVRDTARQLAMSEADLYRKQRVAIAQLATEIAALERRALESQQPPAPGSPARTVQPGEALTPTPGAGR
ncbi:MAG: hypothetical protein IT323_18255 [Anaerolineae bacterium]|nr:hypothetical protein [Anaerolineae bacterium]